MDESGLSSSLRFNLQKASPFSFKCQACGACCHNKAIPVSPYEALGLARNLALKTAEFWRSCVEKESPVLRLKPDGSCIFLRPEGCSVYADRPLVCRLFPLGFIADDNGRQRFGVMPLHPDCLGVLGTDGTVRSYLKSQRVRPYFQADKAG